MGLILSLLFGLAAAAPLLHRGRWLRAGPMPAFAGLALGSMIWFSAQLPAVAAGGTLVERSAWVQRLGLEFHFVLDGLSLMMVLLITGIGTLVLVYGASYLHDHPALPRFFSLLLLFMGRQQTPAGPDQRPGGRGSRSDRENPA